jgi:hypothetical protein
MPITAVPHCYLPNSKVQLFFHGESRCTEFQISRVKEISQQEDFAYFVTCQAGGVSWVIPDDEDCIPGPYSLMWYDKKGAAHCEKIGQLRTLSARSFFPSFIAPLDGAVYKHRCV